MTDYAPRRALGDVLVDLAGAMAGVDGVAGAVRPISIELSLPVEAGLERHDGVLAFIADVPRFRRRTDFDRPPSRLHVTFSGTEPAP